MASLKHAACLTAVVALLSSCGPTLPNDPMPGTYVLTSYAAGPTPDQRLDMIALGVRWTLEVAGDNSVVSKTWVAQDTIAPPTIRSGSAVRSGSSVYFSGFANTSTILTGRQWNLEGNELAAVDQTVAGVNATIRFTRQ